MKEHFYENNEIGLKWLVSTIMRW